MAGSKKSKKKIGRPNRLLYCLGFGLLRAYLRVFCGVRIRIDRSGLSDLKHGPALIIAPHVSGIDHVTVGLACRKYAPTFVLSEHLMAKPIYRFILKNFAHIITKRMFSADAGTVMNIIRAKNEGNVIVLFPEGRMNAIAHTYPVTPGTAELVKRLEIPVYCVIGNGAALCNPKWSKGYRRGLINVETSKVFAAEELKTLTVAEIAEKIESAILHDDEKAMAGRRYLARDTAQGLDGVLYKCPGCGGEFCLKTGQGSVICEKCSYKTDFCDNYRFTDGRFESVNEWFVWQIAELDLSETMEEDITIGAVNEKGNKDFNAGEGHLTLTRDELTLRGRVYDEEIDYTVKLSSLGGTPYTPNREFNIYWKKRLLFLQTRDKRTIVKWVTFIDKAVAEQRGIRLYEDIDIFKNA